MQKANHENKIAREPITWMRKHRKLIQDIFYTSSQKSSHSKTLKISCRHIKQPNKSCNKIWWLKPVKILSGFCGLFEGNGEERKSIRKHFTGKWCLEVNNWTEYFKRFAWRGQERTVGGGHMTTARRADNNVDMWEIYTHPKTIS